MNHFQIKMNLPKNINLKNFPQKMKKEKIKILLHLGIFKSKSIFSEKRMKEIFHQSPQREVIFKSKNIFPEKRMMKIFQKAPQREEKVIFKRKKVISRKNNKRILVDKSPKEGKV